MPPHHRTAVDILPAILKFRMACARQTHEELALRAGFRCIRLRLAGARRFDLGREANLSST